LAGHIRILEEALCVTGDGVAEAVSGGKGAPV
jgi:hypothetical protein